jgi:hypothetical protein
LWLEAANRATSEMRDAFVARGRTVSDFVVSGILEAPCGTAGFVAR